MSSMAVRLRYEAIAFGLEEALVAAEKESAPAVRTRGLVRMEAWTTWEFIFLSTSGQPNQGNNPAPNPTRLFKKALLVDIP